jgi:hypothetical protein
VLTLGTNPLAAGINVPAGYAVNLISGVMQINFNSVAYATESDIEMYPAGGTTEIVQLSAVLGTFLDMNGAFRPSEVIPLQKRLIAGADIMITTPTGTDPTGGDSDVKFWFYYTLIQI